MIKVTGKKNMNFPTMPFQNAKGMKGARVVIVPDKTGRKTSPAAFFAASLMGNFSLWKIRCVFSITTIASSTTIPKANKKANKTIIFKLKPMVGMIKKAIKQLKGTDSATKIAFVAPMKNIKITVTKMKPMMMVLIKS